MISNLFSALSNGWSSLADTAIPAQANERRELPVELLFDALENADIDTLRHLLSTHSGNLMEHNAEGQTLLHVAAQRCDPEVLVAVLKAGADVNARNSVGETPLMTATRHNMLDNINVLTQANAEIDAVSVARDTALIIGAANGCESAVTALLQGHANTHIGNQQGDTAMIAACRFDTAQMLQASPPLHDGNTIEELNLHTETAAIPARIVEDLVSAHANVHAANHAGQTGMMAAASVNNDGVVALLVQAGADIRATDNEGRSALDYAVENGHMELADRLQAWMEQMPPAAPAG